LYVGSVVGTGVDGSAVVGASVDGDDESEGCEDLVGVEVGI